MRAHVLSKFVLPDGLNLEEVPAPDPEVAGGPGVRIEVHAAGVSYADVVICRGGYQVRPPLPFVPGIEVAGRVLDAPDGSGFAPGDRVCAFAFGGGFAEEVVVHPTDVVKLPATLDATVGAGLLVNYGTAWLSLVRRARLAAGETVLVHGAGGGLGTASVALAAALGARVIAVVGSAAKAAAAEAAGAAVVVRTDGPGAEASATSATSASPPGGGWSAAVRAATDGDGVDVAIDPVGGERTDESIRLLRPEGRVVVVGFAGGSIATVKVNRLLLRNATVMGAALREFLSVEADFVAGAMAAMTSMIEDGRLRPTVGSVHPFEDADAALAELSERRAVGKVVLRVR